MAGSLRTAVVAIAVAFTLPDRVHSQPGRAPAASPAYPHSTGAAASSNPLHRASGPATSAVRLPAAFERNKGQFANGLAFRVRTAGGTVGITDNGAITVSGSDTPRAGSHHVTSFHLVGGRRVQPVGLDPAPGHVRYVQGKDPERWIQDVPLYRQVRLDGVYPGIDWEWNVKDGAIEYDFIVHPGAKPRRIALEFGHSVMLRVVDGALNVTGENGVTEHRQPRAYQQVDGARRDIPASWRVEGSRARIVVGRYDPGLPLIIDPVIAWSTYVGGAAAEEASDVVVAPDGST